MLRLLMFSLFVGILFQFCECDNIDLVTKDKLQQTVKQNRYVLVLFVNGDKKCPKCDSARKIMKDVDTLPELYDQGIVILQCGDQTLAKQYGIQTFPKVVYFRNTVPALFQAPPESREITADDLNNFIEEAQEPVMKVLTDESFEHLTQASTGATTGDWFVIFYKDSCSTNLAAVESAGVKLRHRMLVAKIDMELNPALVKRFKVTECPTSYFFRQSKMYHYYTEDKENYNVNSIVSFASSWYKNVKAQYVPMDPSAFDAVTEAIAEFLKEQLNGPNRGKFLIILSVFLAVLTLLVSITVAMCRTHHKDLKEKAS